MLRKLQLHLTKIVLLGLLFTGISLSAQQNIIPVRDQVSGFSTWTDVSVGGSTYLQLLTASSSTTTPAMDFTQFSNQTLNFTARTFGGTNTVENTVTVSISENNGASWSILGTRVPSNNNLVAQTPFDLSSYNGTQVRIRFTVAGTNNGVGVGIDDIAISGIEAPSAPVITAGPATDVTTSSATITGVISSAGESAVTEYGAEYSTTANFEPGTGIVVQADNLVGSDFSLILDELELNTTYYFRVYAANSQGTGYSDQSAFTTQAVGTPVAVDATDTTATTFTASWTTAAEAVSYRLDVSESETFGIYNPATDLFFSEYLEGSSNNKYLEIYNGTGQDVNLNDYQIILYANGSTDATAVENLSGTLADGATRVYRNNQSNIYGGITIISNANNFNGDDAIALRKISTGNTIDVIGTIGVQQNFGADITLRRKSTITSPSTTYNIEDWDSYATDNVEGLGNHDFEGGIFPDYLEGYQNLTVTGTSIQVTGLEPATTYYYRVRAVAGENTSVNSNVISVETGIINIWNGTAWTLGTPPTIDDEAAIEGDYNTAEEGEFAASLLTVNSGTFIIAESTSITVDGAVINNGAAEDFIIENNANLIQVNNDANTGDIYIIKNGSPLYRLDYTIWSSPVISQNLNSFSPNTLEERFYVYDTEADEYLSIDPAANNFEPGAGYLIRMPNGYPNSGDTAGYNDGETAVSFEGIFTGTANNGMISVPLSIAGGGYNMVGNPYPSPINIYDFYDLNTGAIDQGSALYFWRKTNDPNASSYATITKLAYAENEAVGGDTGGTTFIGNPEEWVINPGQGFFVQAATGVDLVFTNTMRRNVNNGQFFRTSEDESISRIWLDVSGSESGFSQSVIGYTDVTTNGLDYGWDGKAINSGGLAFYSLVNETQLSIQARTQFAVTDVVPMGYRADVAGNYTIKLSETDGLFAGDQDVFIKDNVTGAVHNLKDSDYTFATSEGTFNDRLEVVYQNESLSTDNQVLNVNNVIVYKSGNAISINTGNVQMTGVNVYDVRGSLLYSQTGVNATETTIDNLNSQQQVLIINISTDKGEVSRKIVF